jgi:hypothetical protein
MNRISGSADCRNAHSAGHGLSSEKLHAADGRRGKWVIRESRSPAKVGKDARCSVHFSLPFTGIPRLIARPVSRLTTAIRTFFADRAIREFLAWCLPALIIGLALRVLLTWQLPYAYYHDDAPDFLCTPDKLLKDHEFELHAKKTFLVPMLYTVPFLIGLPALIVIPIFQHALGLGIVLLVGLICRLWFKHWKVFILPLTLLTAVNPFFLWYEHTLMAETIYIFCTLLVVLTGTLYTFEQSLKRLIWLAIALVLEAGARPEGKLLFGFGVFLLLLLHWKDMRSMWPRLAVMAALAILIHLGTKTAQAGLLLYTSVVRLTPTELKIAPGFEPYIAPIRADLQRRWDERPQFPKVNDRRAVAAAVEKYLKENPRKGQEIGHRNVNSFCLKLATETCRRNFFYLPTHIYHKFRFVANDSPAGLFDNRWLFDKQREALTDGDEQTFRLSKRMIGYKVTDEAGFHQFIDQNYGEVPWFNHYSDRWLDVVNRFRFPDEKYVVGPLTHTYPGVPYYFLIGAIGVIVMMLRRGTLQPFHIAWGLTLFGFFYVIMLTANVRPRFRIVFEPFWFLYIALLIESAWLLVTKPFTKR